MTTTTTKLQSVPNQLNIYLLLMLTYVSHMWRVILENHRKLAGKWQDESPRETVQESAWVQWNIHK